ncbi:MAG: hypothetical protein ACLPJH_16035 [Myxococcaceae bacterium]
MRGTRAGADAKVARAEEIIRNSGGITVRALAEAMGEGLDNTEKIVKVLRAVTATEAPVVYLSEEREHRERRGPPGRLLKIMPHAVEKVCRSCGQRMP